MTNFIKKCFPEVFENEDIKIILILLFCLLLFTLMIIPINQNLKFEKDGEFYYEKLTEINNKLDTLNSRIDFQTTNINKTINDRFNKGFDCNLTK